jgi:hypothetical protein
MRPAAASFGGAIPQAGTFGSYRVWMTQATLDRWSKREHLSNKPLDCTFVYGNSRVVYNIGGQYSGPWHAPGFDSPIGNVCDYLLSFPDDDDPLLGETDDAAMAGQRWRGQLLPTRTNCLLDGRANGSAVLLSALRQYVRQRSAPRTAHGGCSSPMAIWTNFYPDGRCGDLHKVQIWFEFNDAAVNFSSTGASLQNFTTTGGQKKLPVYRWTFAKRAIKGSASNYTNMFGLVNAANFSGLGSNYRRQLETSIDLENWLKTYAVEHVVGNNDTSPMAAGKHVCL